MPKLLRLRFVSIGHPQARMDDLVLDFRDVSGDAADSTLWLRNGGGKSSILNLFFAIVRPHKGEFLGGKAEAKQRSLSDYFLPGDRSIAVAEWSLDPAAELGFERERFITGVFYERRDAADLRRLFFCCRVDQKHPESTLEHCPAYTRNDGIRTRRTLMAFREAWRALRDRAPHLGVAETENQRDWQETLEAARIDPELFSYQVRMNQREGGADELFRFAEPEDFVDFLLALALDPALGDRVGRNIAAFRRELLQRREQLIPERDLVDRLLVRIKTIGQIRAQRDEMRRQLGEARRDITSLRAHAQNRAKELDELERRANAEKTGHLNAAAEHEKTALEQLARAAHLRLHAADLKVKRLEEDDRQAKEEWGVAQRAVKIWTAAVPLRGALKFEERAREQRAQVEKRKSEHAPLHADLAKVACRYAAALKWRAQQDRAKEREARGRESAARTEAREYRDQAELSGRNQTRAETQAEGWRIQLSAADTKRLQLVHEHLLGREEEPDIGLARWTEAARGGVEAIARIDGEIGRLEAALEALRGALGAANEVLSNRQAERGAEQALLDTARRERSAIESDATLWSALELESVDADRLGGDAIATLEQAARAAQRVVIETKGVAASDERSLLYIETEGLLPASGDTRRILDFLGSRLGGQAWSGWSWIEANVAKNGARDAVRKAPSLAQGIVVRPDDVRRAVELLAEAGLEPDAPLLIADSGALSRWPELPGEVVGPQETAWFNRDAARARMIELQTRLNDHGHRIQDAETQHRQLTSSCESLRSFRTRYQPGWFAEAERRLADAIARESEARRQVSEIEGSRANKAAEKKELEIERRRHEVDLGEARGASERVKSFVEEHFRPSHGWRTELERAEAQAKRFQEEVYEWKVLAGGADTRAADSSDEANRHGQSARGYEVELANLAYVDGDVAGEPAAIDELRDRYGLLRDQYEQKVGADALLALAKQNDDSAREERSRLARSLTAEITEAVVREHLLGLSEPDMVEQQRQDAETRHNSLFGRVGSISALIAPAKSARTQAEEACKAFPGFAPLERAPSTAELAEGEANLLEGTAREHESAAQSARRNAEGAGGRAEQAGRQRDGIGRHIGRLEDLQEAYGDLLAAGMSPDGESLPPSVDEKVLASRIEKLSADLKAGRRKWQEMDSARASATQALRAAVGALGHSRIEAPWVNRLQEHDDPALEDASDDLCAQLETRRSVLDDQIANVERHRTVLVDELNAVADEGLKLLTQASNLSRLPDHVPGLGGAQFLRIQTQTPDDPHERRGRLAELMDDLVGGQRDLSGISLVQAAVRRLARPIDVRVLHPDPALERKTVSIPEMARASGGEQLTGAILLYCTLARIRGRSRGALKRGSSILILDNPIGRASRVRFLDLQREVAAAMGVQLIYTTGVNDHEALRALPNMIRLRNERVDRNSGRRLVEHAPEETGVLEATRIGRREDTRGEAAE
jgi:hypothetical protein